MLKRLPLILSLVLLAGCASGTRIKDFTDRSLGYGWIDIKEVDANSVSSIYTFQHRPKTDEPYYPTSFREFRNGILFYTMALPNGSLKLHAVRGQKCLGFLCGNTAYTYSFGKQGDDVGAVVIRHPGAYHFGSYKPSDVKTGWLEEGKFKVEEATNAPSRREMLQEILKQSDVDEPLIRDRIQRELASLK